MRVLLPALAFLTVLAAPARAQTDLNTLAVAPGYSLRVDSTGFALPTAIAFVPEPGEAPDAPLYFVTELKGAIKVVTNNRTVLEFARVPAARGQKPDLNAAESQGGLAGLCLDPKRGYVFATYTEADASGVLRNRLIRFGSRPGGFGLKAAEARPMDGMLAPFQSAPAHQIGTCVVKDDRLYVGVGDGGNPTSAADPQSPLGKVLCLNTDGTPCLDNPYFRDHAGEKAGSGPGRGDEAPPEAFIYASGFRNPFGLTWAGEQLYAVENGVDLDRFLKVEAGRDHLWRGTDQSLTVLAELVFMPTVSPVQFTYFPPDFAFADEAWRDRFVAAAFGGDTTSAGLIGFGSGTGGRPPELPTHLLEYKGAPRTQHFGPLALGPDGIYTAAMVPGPDGTSAVVKLRHDPAQAHANVVQSRPSLESMSSLGPLTTHACVSCHAIAGKGGGIGPSLDRFGMEWRLTERLNSSDYPAQVARVDALEDEAFARWREARRDVLSAHGPERTWKWLKYFLQEPRFDRPETQMPNLGLTEAEAERLREQLFEVTTMYRGSIWARGLGFIERNKKPLLAGAAAGAAGVLGLVAAAALLLLLLRQRHRSA